MLLESLIRLSIIKVMRKKIPEYLKRYFWEINAEDLDVKKYRIYILKRILEYGDDKAVAWLWRNFKKSEIKDVLINCRGLSQKSANYWAIILGLPRKRVRCLSIPSQKGQKRIWPY